MAWFTRQKPPIEEGSPDDGEKSVRTEGLWQKCDSCGQIIWRKTVEENQQVCPKCGHHFRIGALDRLQQLFDGGQYTEQDAGLRSSDPLHFVDSKTYTQRLEEMREATQLPDAVVCGSGLLDNRRVQICALELKFIGGSMGAVVGEKITRAIERCLAQRTPLIIVSASGGARMQEGAISLMQLAKLSAALMQLDEARLPIHQHPDRSDHGRRNGELCHAGRLEHRGAGSANRICRPARDRADHPPEAARGVSAQRVFTGARLSRTRSSGAPI